MPKRKQVEQLSDPNAATRIVIGVVNLKGGVGKTTTCGYLAQVLFESGHDVVGLDTDPESTWLKWSRTGALPYPVNSSNYETLERDLHAYKGFVVVDTPPNSLNDTNATALFADELIVPLAPTDFDASRLPSTFSPLAAIERSRGKALTSVLLVKWNPRLSLAVQVEQTLLKTNVPLLDSRIRDLTRYTSFRTPSYLDEYRSVLKELEIL